jgi:cupin superfamily acireductone dioxygenase involved in methionine salvage
MSKSDNMEIKQIFLWRLQKENHNAMLQFSNQIDDLFNKNGFRPPEVFQLNESDPSSENMGFVNLAKAVSANPDEEEIWLELHSYRDRKQQEELVAIMQKDETAGRLFKEFMDLIIPGSCIEGRFSRVKV